MHLPQSRPAVWKEGRDGGDRHGVTGTRKFGTRWEETQTFGLGVGNGSVREGAGE